ncbi:hypothetical protein VKT23_009934 [Stygiomarasmius scandens]|uniref:CHAT domain-containing protein n=1 Tax=Marasmiellus scandens TaxID=2682957 RepID=A0ABR1JF81_9AGAR
MADTDEAIVFLSRALREIDDDHQEKPTLSNSLGLAYIRRFENLHQPEDFNSSASALEAAVELTPDGHPMKVSYLMDLGYVYRVHCQAFGVSTYFERALSSFQSAASSSWGVPMTRVQACRSWIGTCMEQNTPLERIWPAYAIMMELVPRTASLGRTTGGRHKELSSIGYDVRRAVAFSIRLGKYKEALEWLDQGRSIVWGQLLNLRTPIDVLRENNPVLADELAQVGSSLDIASTRNPESNSALPGSMEKVAQDHRRFAEEWERLVARVREISGFESFLRPKRLEDLCKAAKKRPIIVINVCDDQCDALTLREDHPNDVLHVPLPLFSDVEAGRLHEKLQGVSHSSNIRERVMKPRVGIARSGGFDDILGTLWSCVVKPVLTSLNISVSTLPDTPPRVTWCTTGSLAFLPIHAAGDYNATELGHRATDFVTSSYAPTISSLLRNISATNKPAFGGLLAVSQQNTPGLTPLYNTKAEVKEISEYADPSTLTCLDGEYATVASVQTSMDTCSWVHFACHGMQNTEDPLRSAFCLEDGHLELGTIITKSYVHTEFAFLSACQTSTGDENLSEEAVHLAAGMQLAGFQSVIATMWSIRDEDGPVVAKEVYSRLFAEEKKRMPDSAGSAHALHAAVTRLREETKPTEREDWDGWFLRWIPFIHLGI